MDGFLLFIINYITGIIIILTLVLGVAIAINAVRLSTCFNFLCEMLKQSIKRTTIDTTTLKSYGTLEKVEADPDKIREYENVFKKHSSWTDILSSMIPVYPMLGILGTVAGLLRQVSASNFDGTVQALGTALSSTLWGLIAAIVLKIFIGFSSVRIISNIENMLDDYYRGFELSNLRKQYASQKAENQEA